MQVEPSRTVPLDLEILINFRNNPVFVRLIFVAAIDYENILTKISRFMVYCNYSIIIMQAKKIIAGIHFFFSQSGNRSVDTTVQTVRNRMDKVGPCT